MKVIIGLGNPGQKYEANRHNLGFLILDKLAKQTGSTFQKQKKNSAEIAEMTAGQDKVLLVKPHTYMNKTGEAVTALKSFYKLENEDILIVHDEVDLAFGHMRYSTNSGSAGHRGVESIISAIGKDLTRLRIGVDNRENRDIPPTDIYVMQDFRDEELRKVKEEIIPGAIEKIEEWTTEN